MKKLIFIILPFIVSCSKCQTYGTIRQQSSVLWFINGDSNSPGIGSNDSASVGEKGSRSNAKILNNVTRVLETLNIGVNNNKVVGILDSLNTHGIELGLTNATDSGRFKQPVYFVKTGFSGAKVSTLRTTYWTNLTTRMDTIKKRLSDANVLYETFMFYSDGINDSNAHVDTLTWKNDNKAYFTSIRALYGQIPIFMPYVPLKGSLDSTLVNNYNIAIANMANEVSDFYPISIDGCYPKTGPHWEYSAFKILAYRVVNELKLHYRFN